MPNGLRIRLDNQNGDRTDGDVLVFCDDVQGALDDQTVAGSSWEVCEGIAYAIVSDDVDLVADLKSEGYSVDQTDYLPPCDEAHALYADGKPFGKEPSGW